MPEKTPKRTARTTRPSTAKSAARPAVPKTPAPDETLAALRAAGPQPDAAESAQAKAEAPVPPTRRRRTPPAAPAASAPAPHPERAATGRGRKKTAAVSSPVERNAPKAPSAPRPRPRKAQAVSQSEPTPAPTPARSADSLSILVVASEAAPFSRTGGLGDIAGRLPAALGALGHSVTLVTPKYAGESRGVPIDRFAVRLGGHSEEAACYEVPLGPNARAILVEHPGFFERDHLYGDGQHDYADNPRRFAFLCRAALEFAARSGERIDVVHAHDWQTALALVFLRTEHRDSPALAAATAALTIHDVAFQGLCAPEWLGMLGISPALFNVEGLEFWGRVSFLKGGIVFADLITTIGQGYARALATGERPSGLEGILAARRDALKGLVGESGEETGQLPPADLLAQRLAQAFAEARAPRRERAGAR